MKFSRYRSVRQQAASNTPQDSNVSTPLPHASPDSQNNSPTMISRSMSRYRRKRDPALNDPSVLASLPPVPRVIADRADVHKHPGTTGTRELGCENTKSEQGVNGSAKFPTYTRNKHQDEDHRSKHRQDAMAALTGGQDSPPQPVVPSRSKTAPSKDRSYARARHEERIKNKDHSKRSSANSDTKRHSWMEKMKNSLSRDTKDTKDTKHAEQSLVTPAGVDAPVSAVNSGERKVRVQYKNSSIILPVNAVTHVQDVLSSASKYWTDINASTFILMEAFTASQIGLERPLRRYEYVREVMNSWAYDSENSLFIIPSASAESLRRLEMKDVSAEQPGDITFYVYHSQRPRKWDKRYITLRNDGQVTVSKKQHGKGETNICHISDFDIYTPTVHTLSDSKAPKRFCYAVKSLQKSSLFISTENFVHFFATDNRQTADDFYEAVQTWRSWYMVHKLGVGDPQVDMNRRNEAMGKTYSNRNSSEHYRSDPESHSQPLIDQATTSKDIFTRMKGTREHAPPPSAFPKNLTIDTDTEKGPLLQPGESPFSPTGLLGQSYTMRQRDMREREEREKQEIFSPQGLISPTSPPSQPASRSNTMKSNQAPDPSGLVKRSHSIRQPKPLVDLTPVFQEPPQHRNKGRGKIVEPGVPLVEAATGPDLAPNSIPIPPATTWRRPQAPDEISPITNAQPRSRYRSNTARSTSNHQQHRAAPGGSASIRNRTAPSSPTREHTTSPENPFVPNSLLSRTTSTRSGRPIGHGVATGDRNATKPMLDLTEDSPFVQGSLLRGL